MNFRPIRQRKNTMEGCQ